MVPSGVNNSPLFVERLVRFPEFVIKETVRDLIIGLFQIVVFTPLAITTLGLSKTINKNAGESPLESKCSTVTPDLLIKVLEILNKDAKVSYFKLFRSSFLLKKVEGSHIFSRHVVSRLKNVGKLLYEVTRRVALLAFGALSLIVAFMTFGHYKKVNTFALKHFNPLGIVAEVSFGIRAIINPFQFDPSSNYSSFNQSR